MAFKEDEVEGLMTGADDGDSAHVKSRAMS